MVSKQRGKIVKHFINLIWTVYVLACTCAVAAPLSDLSAGQTGRIEFQSITPQSIWTYARKNMTDTKSVTVLGDLLMPKNISDKVPAVIYSHGSTGVSAAAFDVWAKELNNAGVALFVVDSYKPRGISETQTNQDQLSPGGQIADALNALKLLATHPKIDATRIFHIGFSRGGNIAYYTAWPIYQRPVETAGARMAGHISIYSGLCEVRYRADVAKTTKGKTLCTLCLPSEPERRKDLEAFAAKSLIHMVGVKGFEPSTPCTPCKCATRLRHTPNQA